MLDPGGRHSTTVSRGSVPALLSRRALWFGGLLLCACVSSSALAEAGATLEVAETFGAYSVSASDAASLRNALRHSDWEAVDHEASPARTSISLTSRLTLEDREDGCAWSGPEYRLDMHTSLPQWSERAQAASELQAQWDEALQGVRVHEEGHRQLAREIVTNLLRQVNELDAGYYRSRPCHAVRKRIGALEARERMRLDLKHDSYDRRTGNGAEQGATLQVAERPTCAGLAFRSGQECSKAASPLCVCPSDAGRLLRDP